MHRTLKQLLYGFFFLLFWVILGLLVYFIFLKPPPSCFDNIQNQGEEGVDCGGPCAKVCVPSTIKPIETAGGVDIFYPVPGSVGLLVKIQNPNADYAAKNFDYGFQIYDYENNLIQSIDGSSFIYAGEIKYIAVPNLAFSASQKIGRVDFVTKNVQWDKSGRFKAPAMTVQNKNAAIKNKTITVSGRVSNNDTLSLPKVFLVVVFYGQSGQVDGVSGTDFDNLVPGETRAFSVSHPPIAAVDLSRAQVFVYSRRP